MGRGKAIYRDASCNALRLVGTHQDITERKQTEKALRESEQRQAEKALRESEDFLNRTGDMAQVGGWELDLNTMKVF